MNPPAWNLLSEYLNVSTMTILLPAPVAPEPANECVEGTPKVSQFSNGTPCSSMLHAGRVDSIAPLIGTSISTVSAVSVIAGASTDTCQRPFPPTVDSGSS